MHRSPLLLLILAVAVPKALGQECRLESLGMGVTQDASIGVTGLYSELTGPGFRGAWMELPGFAYPEDPSRSPLTEVPVAWLSGDGSRLEGRYVRVRSVRLGDITASPDPQGELGYRFEPGYFGDDACTDDLAMCDAFDAVNVYYHVTRMATEFWEARLGVDVDFQAEAAVHVAGNGAAADLDRMYILFRLGETYMRNAAREDDVIYHEYAHLAISRLGFVPGYSSPIIARAVSEGFADYFAATFTDDPSFGEYQKTCTPRFHCDGPENDPNVRNLASDPAVWNWRNGSPDPDLKYGVCTRYHEEDGKCKVIYINTAAVYVWSMIWSGMMWDLRTALGRDTVDFLAVEALRHLQAKTTDFEAAARALIVADATLFDGRHVEIMGQVMARRGIVPESAHTAGAEDPGADGFDLEIFPNPAAGDLVVRWPARPVPGSSELRVVDSIGRTVYRSSIGTLEAFDRIPTRGWAPGVYQVVVSGRSTPQVRSLVVVR